jgi:hypothetical protein
MTVHDPSRQQILDEFQRRRGRALLSLLPFLAGFGVLFAAINDVDLAGLSSEQMVIGAFVLIGLSVVAYIAVWRCPVCNAGFSRGLSVPLCPQCGTVFSGPGETAAVDPAARREHLEKALADELKKYRSERSVFRTKGVIAIFFGLLAGIGIPLTSDSMRTDTRFYQTFGDQAPLVAGLAVGGGLVLIGVLIVVWQTRSINAGARRHERQLREKMGLPPSL